MTHATITYPDQPLRRVCTSESLSRTHFDPTDLRDWTFSKEVDFALRARIRGTGRDGCYPLLRLCTPLVTLANATERELPSPLGRWKIGCGNDTKSGARCTERLVRVT